MNEAIPPDHQDESTWFEVQVQSSSHECSAHREGSWYHALHLGDEITLAEARTAHEVFRRTYWNTPSRLVEVTTVTSRRTVVLTPTQTV